MSFKPPTLLSNFMSFLTRRQQRVDTTLNVVGSVMLSQRDSVWIVEVGESWLVLGSGVNGLTTLGQLHKGGLPLTMPPSAAPFNLETLLESKKSAQQPVEWGRKGVEQVEHMTTHDAPEKIEVPSAPSAFAPEPSAASMPCAADAAPEVDEQPVVAAEGSAEAERDEFPSVDQLVAAEGGSEGADLVAMPIPAGAAPVETAEQLAEKFAGIRAVAERVELGQLVSADAEGFPDPALAVEAQVSAKDSVEGAVRKEQLVHGHGKNETPGREEENAPNGAKPSFASIYKELTKKNAKA